MQYRMNIDPECPFCRWIREGRAVDTHGSVAAFEDGYPVTAGHLLIVPFRHTRDGLSMSSLELRDAEALVRTLVEKIRGEDPSVTGFNIGMNVGESAGQTVFHAHIHLIPRRDGDCGDPTGGVRGVIDGKRCYGSGT
jgi:diadenosine tetraphosphate (Ap4A) HIT family hydrolase